MSGATEHGNTNLSFEERKKHELRIGKILEYRIGMYVATKRDRRSKSSLYFQHFWDRGEISDAFEKKEPKTVLTYRTGDLELLTISRLIPKTRNLGFAIITTYPKLELWNIGKS